MPFKIIIIILYTFSINSDIYLSAHTHVCQSARRSVNQFLLSQSFPLDPVGSLDVFKQQHVNDELTSLLLLQQQHIIDVLKHTSLLLLLKQQVTDAVQHTCLILLQQQCVTYTVRYTSLFLLQHIPDAPRCHHDLRLGRLWGRPLRRRDGETIEDFTLRVNDVFKVCPLEREWSVVTTNYFKMDFLHSWLEGLRCDHMGLRYTF